MMTMDERLAALTDRLGDTLGRYAVAAVVLTLMGLPIRFWVQHGDPVVHIVALSGLNGTIYALMVPAAVWWTRRQARREGAAQRPHLRVDKVRGAWIGLAVGVPFFLGFIVFCLMTERPAGYPGAFAVGLVAIVVVAVRNLRHAGSE